MPSVTFMVHVVHPFVCPGVRCAVTSMKASELSPQANLAEVTSLPQIVEGLSQFRETKDPIHHGTHGVKCNRLVHRFEHFARAHVDRFYASTLAHERNEVDFRSHADEKTYKRDRASQAHSGD